MYLEQLRQKIIPVLKQHNVLRAGIFGSFVRDKIRPDIARIEGYTKGITKEEFLHSIQL